MYITDIDQNFIDQKLSSLGNKLLNSKYKNNWNKQNPTAGYCYILSEAIYHYSNDDSLQVYCINLGNNGVHWYLKQLDSIIDFTANQFDFTIDYSKGKHIGFLKGKYKTNRGYISARGKELAEYLGIIKRV